MKLIKYLGTMKTSNNLIKKRSFGIYECPLCMKHFKVATATVKNGTSTKCRECAIKTIRAGLTQHGDCKRGKVSRLYTTWLNMKSRCYYKKNKSYKNYGGRGIKVCTDWIKSYDIFKEWAMNSGYKKELTIDRINNDGNYEPSNCRWATIKTQARNTRLIRSTNTSGYRGISKKPCGNWEARIGVGYSTIYLGYFTKPWTAAYAYDAYVLKHNLEHTRNFPSK